MLTITSRDNPGIKLLTKLLAQGKERRSSGLFVLEGLRLVEDAMKSGVPVQSLYLTAESAERYPHLLEKAGETALLSVDLMQKISDTQTPQGVIAVCSGTLTSDSLPQSLSGGALLLCSLQDPGNMGAIIRSAEALSLSAVLLTQDCPDVTSPKVLRASMGAALRLPLVTFPDGLSAIAALKQRGIATFAAAISSKSRSVHHVSLHGSCVVIGNEGAGLSATLVDACEHSVSIPMNPKSESLNAAAAAAIFAWEISRSAQGGEMQ